MPLFAVNECVFSACRRYRYTLKHRWVTPGVPKDRFVMWIGLNPSTADEQQLDPTLRRIKGFTTAMGCSSFVMTNLFAFRATDPVDMKVEVSPVGAENDHHLAEVSSRANIIVACWGVHGSHMHREAAVRALLKKHGRKLMCLGTAVNGAPRHPLYLSSSTKLIPY